MAFVWMKVWESWMALPCCCGGRRSAERDWQSDVRQGSSGRCRRFIYGYTLDHSEFPCYLLWPCRDQGEYWLVDTMTDDYLLLSTKTYFRPLELHHFYDAFSLDGRSNLRKDALAQFQLVGSGASTKNNPKLRLLVQQDGIGFHKASLPQNKGRRNKGIRRRRQVSPVRIQRSLVTNRMDLLMIMPALPSPRTFINMGSW